MPPFELVIYPVNLVLGGHHTGVFKHIGEGMERLFKGFKFRGLQVCWLWKINI